MVPHSTSLVSVERPNHRHRPQFAVTADVLLLYAPRPMLNISSQCLQVTLYSPAQFIFLKD